MKIKVKLLAKVSLFQYEGKVYVPGDVFMVDTKNFVGYLMTKVLEKPLKREVVKEPSKETVVESTPVSEVTVQEASKPKPRKRQTNA